MSAIVCCECGVVYDGPRDEARRQRWEPYRTRTQADVDRGPLVCPHCVAALLDAVLQEAKRWAARV